MAFANNDLVTTLAVGEEAGSGPITSKAIGEEAGGGPITSKALGEEAGSVFPVLQAVLPPWFARN